MDLFAQDTPSKVMLATGACWLSGFALPCMPVLWPCLAQHLSAHPPRQMMTPMGYPMSVRTSSMGDWGWVGSAAGYGYQAADPANHQPWPAMPEVILQLAATAAQQAGYADFVPDSCLINVYAPGSKMGLHQDKDEQDFTQPIVSVSLGLPATFLFGGARRTDKPVKIPLVHGDVVVWGGASRRFYHGVAPVQPGQHLLIGPQRINLTLRKAR
ncbi:DNA oxidative demethylase AlkB [Methylophilus sp. VKM B-3414]|uniref:DNA oxidative demethylase AlkB n=1 Tax=Methylophilus sp. VKM B-3414 TaxID=3076121 RepID=UPI0028C7955B|nr:DNA oxidative demethylase AlkB [Methylophilus sp. VKM B-3414]MDT7848732.1 DNA oxidative demethylase AlkB [Methylophilus sp. VKM B-3414]